MSGRAAPVLCATGLRRRFGATVAVDGLDLTLRRGELTAVAGPDGAGKTTTIRILAGLLAADAGTVRLGDVEVTPRTHSVRARIGYMPQQYCLYGDLSIDENLRFFADLFGLDRSTRRHRVSRLLEVTRLEPFRGRRADALSGGMYKKLALACALLHQPEVLLLDEPSNGVDPVSRRELWLLLHEFTREGMAVLVATPYMDEAERCHHALLVDAGRVLAEGSPRALSDAFPHALYTIEFPGGAGGERDALEDALAERRGVLGVSPYGAGLRVIVAQDATRSFEGGIGEMVPHAELSRGRAGFEDVYLSALSDREAQA